MDFLPLAHLIETFLLFVFAGIGAFTPGFTVAFGLAVDGGGEYGVATTAFCGVVILQTKVRVTCVSAPTGALA
jgi:hypothetical protein